jgi:uncharacterized protein YuzE
VGAMGPPQIIMIMGTLWLVLRAPEAVHVGTTSNLYHREILRAPMKITYDAQVDVLRILLSNAAIEESDEKKPGIILDFDKIGNVVGMEILDASKRMENPKAVEYTHIG